MDDNTPISLGRRVGLAALRQIVLGKSCPRTTPSKKARKAQTDRRMRKAVKKLKKLQRISFLEGLTPKEQAFVIAYLDYNNHSTFLNATGSVLVAGYNVQPKNASRLGWQMIQKEHIKNSIREALNAPEITELVTVGVKERLKTPTSPYWQPTADYVAKIRGEFAPEKQIQMTLGAPDRDQRYAEIMNIVQGKQTEAVPEAPQPVAQLAELKQDVEHDDEGWDD